MVIGQTVDLTRGQEVKLKNFHMDPSCKSSTELATRSPVAREGVGKLSALQTRP